MTPFQVGLAHVLVTPFDVTGRVDYAALPRLIDFHIANGAQSLAVPMHAGEAVSLPDAEKRELLTAVLARVAGRVPVIAHATDSGTAIAADLARFAERAGASAIVSSTPYYWTPPPAMLVAHFAGIAAAVSLPFYVHNAPEEMAGVKVDTAMMLKLIGAAPNFIGVVDSGLDWQFMIELMTDAPKARPGFQLVSGTDYFVSARAIGASGLISQVAGIAPGLVRRMYDDCAADRLFEARAAQEAVAALGQILKPHGVAGLKAAMRIVGRDVGSPRPPLRALTDAQSNALAASLAKCPGIADDVKGW